MCTVDAALVKNKLEKLLHSFTRVLYEPDATFMANMQRNGATGPELDKYRYWEWTQGVGLYGFWKLYEMNGDEGVLETLKTYYERQLAIGLPGCNVNTTAPMLALSFLYEKTGDERYGSACRDWATQLVETLPRTREGGFQHMTSDSLNPGELWDDTLYMAVLFLARAARLFKREDWRREAEYQFLLHAKYLVERRSGLWYHGWTFEGNHNFAGALWARGNCWVTAGIPEYLRMARPPESVARFLTGVLARQAESLAACQSPGGMWHTLLNDATSYEEASGTCGIGYGLLMGVRQGLLAESYRAVALKALAPVLACINGEGIVGQVSYGTPMGRESLDFYRSIPLSPMPYGQALAIMYLLEVLQTPEAGENALHPAGAQHKA